MGKADIEPQEISAAQLAFPAGIVGKLLPAEEDIPKEFRDGWHSGNKWCDLASEWFYNGLDGRLVFIQGIDRDNALRHLGACLRSFEPSHQHKIAGVGYLMSLWVDEYIPPE